MSSTKLIATSISLLFAFVFGVSGMGLFHAAHFYEVNKVIQVQFLLRKLWQNRKNSHFDEFDKNLSFAAVCFLKNFLLNLA